jgi:hypothetical protein
MSRVLQLSSADFSRIGQRASNSRRQLLCRGGLDASVASQKNAGRSCGDEVTGADDGDASITRR